MSYLPRMSKTYKEPQEHVLEETEENLTFNTLKPASSLLNEKTHNPQMVLKHYKYLPHAPPVLPGPSLLEEALENEFHREASRMKISASKMETLSRASEIISELPLQEVGESILLEDESKLEVTDKVKRSHIRKGVKGNKSNLGRKKSAKGVRKEQGSNVTINMCTLDTKKLFNSVQDDGKNPGEMADPEKTTKFLISQGKEMPTPNEDFCAKIFPDEKQKIPKKELTNRSAQCTIFGSLTKVFVVPAVINTLLRALAFLLHEINQEETLTKISKEKKTLMTQIQLILGDLTNQKVDRGNGFDIFYSDLKRLEKILGELKKYMKDNYGDKGEFTDKMEYFRKIFTELKKKEMELAILKEKIQETEEKPIDVVVKETDLKNPEITLQNKRLESEQLSAEVEFSCIEIRNYQKSLAELDWDIRHCQRQMATLRKSSSFKSKTEVLGKKISVHKFSSQNLTRGTRNKTTGSSCNKMAKQPIKEP